MKLILKKRSLKRKNKFETSYFNCYDVFYNHDGESMVQTQSQKSRKGDAELYHLPRQIQPRLISWLTPLCFNNILLR